MNGQDYSLQYLQDFKFGFQLTSMLLIAILLTLWVNMACTQDNHRDELLEQMSADLDLVTRQIDAIESGRCPNRAICP